MAKNKTTPLQSHVSSGTNDSGHKMLDIIEAYDWSGTSLGEISEWHPVVVTMVSVCLNASSPMLLLWGEDMIQIYNDAYRKIIGIKHNSVGQKASEVWSAIWSEIGPLLQTVRDNGAAVQKENSKFILERDGVTEECYFTFSYNPVFLSPGVVGGIMVIVQETTQSILTEQKLTKLRDEQISNLFVQAPIALCIFKGKDFVVEVANERMLSLWGRTKEEVINKPVFEGVPAAKNQGFEGLLNKVLQSGERIVIEESTLDVQRGSGSEIIYIKFVYEPLRDSSGSITGVMGLADEITDQVLIRKRIEESDIRQKIAIEAASIGTFEWNIHEGSFQYSDRLAQIFGFPTNEQGLDQSDLGGRIHPDDQAKRLASHQQSFETGVLFYEARIIWPDQSIRWVRVNGKVVYNIYGKPARMYGTTLDITEQRIQAERLENIVEQRTQNLQERNNQLKRSEERYHRMIDEIQDYAIILLDRDGVIQNWNKGAEKIKLYHESEVVGKNFRIFYLPEDRNNNLPERLINNAATHGRAMHEGWRVRKDGSKFWGSITITAMHDNQQNVVGFSKVTRDLTERKLADDKLKAYTVELEAQNRELEQFAYVASHDLQEPLRKIQTFCEVIQKNNLDEATSHRYFPKIIAAAQRMSELIRSVLNYSRLSREGVFEPVDLNSILTNILNDYELLISEKDADVQFETMPEIMGIPLQISQLLSNLIGNALKFTLVNPVVRIKSRKVQGEELSHVPIVVPQKQYLEISVEDNGIGFDQKYEKLIFAMFQRLNSKHEYAGTGIGLALCKKIIENHDGFITAKSEPGKGSVFQVYIPYN